MDSYRDWGFAGDYVEAIWMMLQKDIPDDYVIATGTTTRVMDFLSEVFEYAGLGDYQNYLEIDPRFLRPHEVPYLLGDSTKAKTVLNWEQRVSTAELAHMMYDSDYNEIGEKNDKR